MLICESHIFELWIEMKFEVCDPHSQLMYSIEKSLQNSGLNGIRTLTSEMAVQLPIEQSGLPPSYVSSVKETATTTHSKLQHKTIPIICKIIHVFFYPFWSGTDITLVSEL